MILLTIYSGYHNAFYTIGKFIFKLKTSTLCYQHAAAYEKHLATGNNKLFQGNGHHSISLGEIIQSANSVLINLI